MQVSGRVWKKNVSGNIIIQTYQPKHPVIKMCKDYKFEVLRMETNQRKKKSQPPFSNFISISFSKVEEKCISRT